ncbi:MAG: ATP-binding protein [Mycobacterium sp.]
MTEHNSTATSDTEGFVRAGVVANPLNVARLRDELDRWLRLRLAMESARFNDVVLAVNEALANVAEFAYRNAAQAGTVDIRADHDRATSILTVTVIDLGCWRDSTEREPKRTRGRGIPLMEALSDEVLIDATDHGTTVSMRFGNVSVAGARHGDEVPTV